MTKQNKSILFLLVQEVGGGIGEWEEGEQLPFRVEVGARVGAAGGVAGGRARGGGGRRPLLVRWSSRALEAERSGEQ